jgi:hypothetical protein
MLSRTKIRLSGGSGRRSATRNSEKTCAGGVWNGETSSLEERLMVLSYNISPVIPQAPHLFVPIHGFIAPHSHHSFSVPKFPHLSSFIFTHRLRVVPHLESLFHPHLDLVLFQKHQPRPHAYIDNLHTVTIHQSHICLCLVHTVG